MLRCTFSSGAESEAGGAFFCSIDAHCQGQRTPNDALFSSKSQTFGLGQTIWADKFWGIWVFSFDLSALIFGTLSLLSIFSLINHYFYNKLLPLYPTTKYLSGIRFWIWAGKNLRFSHRVSVVGAHCKKRDEWNWSANIFGT